MAFARDKFWMFGVRPHQDDIWLKPADNRSVPYRQRSRITPAEGAMLLDAQNMLMVNCDGEPAPFSEEALGYAESFARMKRVLWGGTGSGGFRIGNEEAFICKLAEKYPNIAGEFLDDLSSRFHGVPDRDARALEFLRGIRAGLDKAPRRMDLYVTWYWHETPYPGMMDYVDGFSFWTWQSAELPRLAERFEAAEEIYRQKKILLGIYMYDFPARHPVSLDLMEYQCEYALSLLRQGRIDGMIFEANSVMGVGLESEAWLRAWVDRVKDTEVPD